MARTPSKRAIRKFLLVKKQICQVNKTAPNINFIKISGNNATELLVDKVVDWIIYRIFYYGR